ncbi:hypothetical protein ACGVWS_01475 [Enterobacteriaceae bacterium LUAb1]
MRIPRCSIMFSPGTSIRCSPEINTHVRSEYADQTAEQPSVLVEVQDSGERLDIARFSVADGQHIIGAMVIAEEKSDEHLGFAGEAAFVGQTSSMVKWFNEGVKNRCR